ncbi:hypothetical protein GCM10009603_24320 [Nocardiopsis exhalans]
MAGHGQTDDPRSDDADVFGAAHGRTLATRWPTAGVRVPESSSKGSLTWGPKSQGAESDEDRVQYVLAPQGPGGAAALE